MPVESIIILIAILIALTLVVLFFFFSSVHWHEELDLKMKDQPLHSQMEQQLSNLRLPKEKIERTMNQLTEIVSREVSKETKKVQFKMEKIIESKEKEIKQIHDKYRTVEQSYQKLGKQKAQTESVVRSIAKGVIVLNDEGKVVFLNPNAEKILGVKSGDLLGRQISNVEGDHIISMVNEEGVEEQQPGMGNRAKDDLKEHTAVIETVYGQTKGVISILPALNPQKKVEEFKNEFLANITHELRSPLVCIQKAVQALMERSLPEEKQYFEIAARNAARLEKLVNDILDLAKLESGKIYLRYEILALAPFIEEIRGNFRAWAEEKQIQIQSDIPNDPVVFEADRYRLGQVLSNFITNALKFTPRHGKITIDARMVQEAMSEPARIQLGVRDTGQGIDEADQKTIFQKFAFVSTRPTEGEKGTGLGLSIAKEIVELHGGKIWVESKRDQGSYFAFSLPLKKPA